MESNVVTRNAQVKALIQPGKHYCFAPFGHPGRLGLRVSPKGKQAWIISYRINGKKSTHTIGTYPSIPLSEARKEAATLLQGISEGIDPNGVKKQYRAAPAFNDLCEEYLSHHACKKKDGGHADKLKLYNKRLDPLRKGKAQDIRRRDVIQVLDDIAEEAPISANRYKALLSKLFNVCIRRDLLPDTFVNPAANIDKPTQENSRDRVYSHDEMKALWNSFDGLRPGLSEAMKVLTLTGQRLNEIMKLEWQEINMEGLVISLPGSRTKNGRPHEFPISPMVVEIFGAESSRRHASKPWLASHTGYVFKGNSRRHRSQSDKGKPISLWNRDRQFIRRESGVADFRPHDLRRTMVTLLAREGVSRFILDRLTNHVDGTVGGIYDRHDYFSEMRDAVNQWEGVVKSIIL